MGACNIARFITTRLDVCYVTRTPGTKTLDKYHMKNKGLDREEYAIAAQSCRYTGSYAQSILKIFFERYSKFHGIHGSGGRVMESHFPSFSIPFHHDFPGVT